MNQRFNKSAQGGFTLIELIVVIVILGILAATALPKFASLSGDARAASVQAAKGSISSASAMLHGKWLIKNETTIKVENETIKMLPYGYPEAGSIREAAGLSGDDYTMTGFGSPTTTFYPKGLPDNLIASCQVSYSEPTATVAAPVIKINVSKCE